MTGRSLIMAGIALATIGYLIIEFGRLVVQDRANDHDACEGPAYDADTVAWLKGLAKPASEFDDWCAQAIALTREPGHADLVLWEDELADGAR